MPANKAALWGWRIHALHNSLCLTHTDTQMHTCTYTHTSLCIPLHRDAGGRKTQIIALIRLRLFCDLDKGGSLYNSRPAEHMGGCQGDTPCSILLCLPFSWFDLSGCCTRACINRSGRKSRSACARSQERGREENWREGSALMDGSIEVTAPSVSLLFVSGGRGALWQTEQKRGFGVTHLHRGEFRLVEQGRKGGDPETTEVCTV